MASRSAPLNGTRSQASSNRWLLPALPDGRKALAFAQEALKLASNERLGLLQAVAASNAELGDFGAAARTQECAIALINPNHVVPLERAPMRLALYRSGKPYRDKPLAPEGTTVGR